MSLGSGGGGVFRLGVPFGHLPLTFLFLSADIEQIISDFYKRLINDESMYLFFKEIVEKGLLEHHLAVIVDFWEDLLFHSHKYKNNPMKKHLDFHKRINFKKNHFNLWLQYLSETIDESFQGITAENMKTRATSIAMVMQVKMNLYSDS